MPGLKEIGGYLERPHGISKERGKQHFYIGGFKNETAPAPTPAFELL